MKKLIVHATAAKIILTAIYMHLWHECLEIKNRKIMVRLKTETEHLCKRGDRIQGYSMEQEFCMTRLDQV